MMDISTYFNGGGDSEHAPITAWAWCGARRAHSRAGAHNISALLAVDRLLHRSDGVAHGCWDSADDLGLK